MKTLVQSYVLWPGMDTEIENHVKSCHACQENMNSQAKTPLHSREKLDHAWSGVYRCMLIMLAHVEGSMFLIVVDTYSNWIPIRHATPHITVDKL